MLCICSKIPADSLIKALTDTFSAAFFQLWWLLCSIGASHPAMNQDFRGNHPLLSQLLLSISPMRPCDSTRRGASDGELLCRLCNYTIEQTDCLGAVGGGESCGALHCFPPSAKRYKKHLQESIISSAKSQQQEVWELLCTAEGRSIELLEARCS